jgi:hypothetical protein
MFRHSPFRRALFSISRKPLQRGKPSRLQLLLEQLEDRTLLNAAPIVDIGSNLQVDEGQWFDLNGSFSDEDGFGGYNGEIYWGDSPFPTWFWRPDPGDFEAAHAYADDGVYQVVAEVTDAGGATGSDAIQVVVDNVAPSFSNLEITSPVNEGSAASLHGFVTDPGWADEVTVTIDWGDGSEPTEIYWPYGGTHEFGASHIYVDDNPSGTPHDDYTVHLTASDDDGGTTSVDLVVRVNNVAPTLSSLAASSAAENDFVTLTGSIADPGVEDTFTVTVHWGDGSPPDVFTAGLGAFERTHRYLDDDPSGTSSDNLLDLRGRQR